MSSRDANQRLTASFYNGSNNGVKNINVQTLLDMGQKVWNESPFDSVLWYPKIKITNCYYSYIFRMIMYQLVPALLVDGLLKLMGKQPM